MAKSKQCIAIAGAVGVAVLALIIGLSIHFLQTDDGDAPYPLCYFDETSGTYITADAENDSHGAASPCVGEQFVDTSVFNNIDDLEGVDEEETYTSNYFVSFLKAGIIGLAASEDIIKNVNCKDGAIDIVFSMPVDSKRIQSMFPASSVIAVDGIVFGNCTVTESNQSDETANMASGFLLVHSVNLSNIDMVTVLGEGVPINYLFQERNIVYEPFATTEGGGTRKLEEQKRSNKLVKAVKKFYSPFIGVTFSVEVDPTVDFEPKLLRDYWRLTGEKWYNYDPYVDFELLVQYQLGLKLGLKTTLAAGVQLANGTDIPFVGFVPIPSLGFKLPRLVVKILRKILPKQDITRAIGFGFEMPYSVSMAYSADVSASVSSGLVLNTGETTYRCALKGVPPLIRPTFETVSTVPATATAMTPVYEKIAGKLQMSVKAGVKPSVVLNIFGFGEVRVGFFSGLQFKARPFIFQPAPPIINATGNPLEIDCEECHKGELDISLVAIGDPFIHVLLFLNWFKVDVPSIALSIPVFKICGDIEEELTCGEKCCESENATCTLGDDGIGICDQPTSFIPTFLPISSPTFPPTVNPFDPFKTTRGTSDPHFITWNGRFSYQGACDLVYVDTDLIKVHIRTTLSDTGHFSYISAMAASIAGDIFEYDVNGTYFVNKQKPIDLPTVIGGYPLAERLGKFSIDLANGQFLRISTYRNTLTVDIRGHVDYFSESRGITGSFREDMAVRRDGNLFDGNAEEIASEWLVDSSLGDELLFVEGSPHAGCMEAVPFNNSDAQQVAAEQACSRFEGVVFDNCVFDVLASNGDTEWARNPGFNPVQETIQEILENDTCDLATIVSSPYNTIASTIGAQPDDVNNYRCSRSYPSTNGIWYSFTKSTGTIVRTQIDPVDFKYTLLRIYSGECDSLVCVMAVSKSRGDTVDVVWFAEAGVKYQLLVSELRFGVDIESFSLSIQDYEVPEHDTCELAATITFPYTVNASTVGALPDPDDSYSRCRSSQNGTPNNGIWYSFTASTSALVRVQIEAGLDDSPYLRVYSGECDSLVCVTAESESSGSNVDEFWAAEAGVKYQILVSEARFGVGIESFSMSIQDYEVPENDTCELATTLSLPYTANATTLGALPDIDETFCGSARGTTNGIWYSYITDTNAIVRVQIDAGDDEDTHLRVYSGECDSMVCVTEGYESRGDVDAVWFAEAGVQYQLLISERFYELGIDSLSLSIQHYEVPENDTCDFATPISLPYNAEGSTIGALPYPDDTDCAPPFGNEPNGIWYSFTATTSAIVRAKLDAGASFDSLLRVYSGECDSLVCVASDSENSGKVEVIWFAEAGVKYQLLVSEKRFRLGIESFTLSIQEYEVPENGTCDTATSVAFPFTGEDSSIGALPDHPDAQGCGYKPNAVWYSFTMNTGAVVRAHMDVGYTHDTLLRVFSGECDSLVCVVKGGRYTGEAEVFFFAEAGVPYQLSFSDTLFGLGFESFSMSIQDYEVPENDTCDFATPISLPYTGEGRTIGALPDRDDTACATSGTTPNGIWYSFTASSSANVRAQIDATSFYNTLLRVYIGECDSLVCVPFSRTTIGYRGDVDATWFAEAGVTYQLLVSEKSFGLGIDTFSITIDVE